MHLKDSVDEFDRNQISPDTPYMKKLENELQNRFPNIKISPTQKSGEGEHKILQYIKNNIKFVPLRKNEGQHTKADIEFTFKRINWKAQKNLIYYINKNIY